MNNRSGLITAKTRPLDHSRAAFISPAEQIRLLTGRLRLSNPIKAQDKRRPRRRGRCAKCVVLITQNEMTTTQHEDEIGTIGDNQKSNVIWAAIRSSNAKNEMTVLGKGVEGNISPNSFRDKNETF
ncbi:hypothetical protein L596_001434 [Steinernema carpocapsae]|uniref:Uncharacterized protein n=1 Tax=Steinernema carpocapsae TaxID=34508 RepID=A0A4U8UQ95_STECR|nr:hypothetical protein L596_001434 [Steinernema carpocapsae]